MIEDFGTAAVKSRRRLIYRRKDRSTTEVTECTESRFEYVSVLSVTSVVGLFCVL